MKYRRLSPEILLHNTFWHSSHTKLDYVWQMPSQAPCVLLLWETQSIASYFPSKSLIQVVFQAHSLIFFKSCFLSWQSHADFLESFFDLRPGIEMVDCFHKAKQRERKCHVWLFLHSAIPALSLSLPKCPTPIGFQTPTSSFWYPDQHFTVFLHSLCHAMGRIQSQPGVRGKPCICRVRVRQWMVLTGEREEPTSLSLLFNLPIMQLIDFVHMQDIPFLVHLLIQVLLLPGSSSSFVKHWLPITEILVSLFPTGKNRRYSIGQIYSEIIFPALPPGGG